jgi:PAS domain S-box-containing protein
VGNWLSVPVAYSVSFVFGSIFTIIVVGLFGIWWGAAAALVASSYTYVLWGHPYAIVIFIAEILWIGTALRKNRSNILLIDSLFWLLPGALFVLLFYGGVMKLGAQNTTIIYLKQGLNGILNALVASAVMSYFPLKRWLRIDARPSLISYSTIFLHVTTAFVVIPAIGILLITNYREISSSHESVSHTVREEGQGAERVVTRWMDQNRHAVQVLADFGATNPLRPSPKLQNELARIKRLFPDFHNVYLADQTGTTVAFYPSINEKGERTIGLNFSDRPYFRQLNQTLRPVVSGVFPGRGGVFSPIITISVPIVRNGQFAGYSLGAINLEHLSTLMKGVSPEHVVCTILDEKGSIIASTDSNRRPLSRLSETYQHLERSSVPDVFLRVAGAKRNVSVMDVWKDSFYLTKIPVAGTTWVLLAEYPIAPLQKYFYSTTIKNIGTVAIFFVLALIFSSVIARKISRVPALLASLSRDIPGKLQKQEPIQWPATRIAEMLDLIDNFQETGDELGRKIDEARTANIQLETRVRERTEALNLLNERFSLAAESAKFGVWDWDVKTNSLVWDRRMFSILGVSEAEFSGSYEAWAACLHPDDGQEASRAIQRALRGEAEFDTQFRVVWPSGEIRHIKANAIVVRGADGSPVRMTGINYDITQQRQTELALRNAYERTRALMESVQSGIILVRAEDRIIVEANAAAARIMGTSIHEMIGKPARTYVCPEEYELCPAIDLGKEEENVARDLKKVDDSLVSVLKTVKHLHIDGQIHLLESFVDISELKRAEEEMRASEENFRTFFSTVDDMVVVTTLDGQVVHTNPAVSEKLGYNRDELSTMHVLDLHPESMRAEGEEILAALLRKERTACPLPLATKTGDLVSVETRIWFGRWSGSDCIFSISKDLTAEREAQERFERLFSNNPALMAVSELPERRFTDVNDAFLSILGYPRNLVIGRTVDELGLFPNPEQQKAVADMLVSQGRISDIELQVRHRNGAILDGLFSGEVISSQGKQFFLTVMIDITERRRAGNALRESEETFRSISTSAQDAIIMMDSDGVITYWNESATRIFGYDHSEAVGKDLHSFLAPQRFHGPFQKGLQHFAKHGTGDAVGKRSELYAIRKDGTEFPIELSLSAINIRNKWVAIGILRDVSERRQAEERLRETNRRLEAATVRANELAEQARLASKAKSEFLANMSHEIRTPMNGVIGMAGLLIDTDLTEEQRRYAEILSTCAESLLGLINDILDFSRIEARKLELESLDFDLRSLLENTMATLAFRSHEKGLKLSWNCDSSVPALVRGDPGRLRQVLTNLTSNAIKFTGSGEVTVVVSLVDEAKNDMVVHFSVRDTGIGIPADKIPLLFDKFSQVDASTTRKYGGTGLGLAISKELVELTGGQIGVKSEVGKGSEFWFTVRLGRQGDQGLRADTDRSLETSVLIDRNARILLVEDSVTNQQVALGILKKLGFSADTVSDGAEAIKRLEFMPYDMVLMDVQMPVMDGLEATQHIRNPETAVLNHAVPVVAMTAHAMEGDREKCLAAGMSDYITKPIFAAALTKVFEKWLPWKEVEPESGAVPRAVSPKEMLRQPVFDKAGLMDRLMDDIGLARTVADGFAEDVTGLLESLKVSIEAADAAAVQLQAHTIKGAAANVGGERLRAVALEMEKAARMGDIAPAGACLAALQMEFGRLIEAMKEEL